MKQTLFFIPHLLLFLCVSISIGSPKLTVVIMIDNLSHANFSRIQPYLHGGIALLAKNGLRYGQALWPHTMPSTATGHTGLVSGTIAANHGIIDNKWIDAHGNKVAFDDDRPDQAAVFSPDGLYSYGKSAHNIMVDTLADQIMLANKNYKIFSLSLKSRSAIAMAGKLGKAIWYDNAGHQFTSSQAYFNALPGWVRHYNQTLKKELATTKKWKLFFDNNNPAYAQALDYTYAFARKKPLVEKVITKNNFEMTPAANTALLKLAQTCLAQEFSKNQQESFLLFLSISSTDKVFHQFGPDSLEYLDMLYHLDTALKSFIDTIYKNVKPEDVLFVLSSDHGGIQIVETLQQQGYTNALRIDTQQLKNNINKSIQKNFNISNLVVHIDTPDIYLDHSLLEEFSKKARKKIVHSIKRLVQEQPGIKKVWTFKQLQKTSACVDEFEKRYKQQLFAGRSGDLIFQVFPYTYASKYDKGTGHKTPYDYDTHVPLIVYKKGTLESKKILQKVWVPQVAPTLAQLLGVPKPSATTFDTLPGIVY